MNEDDVGGEAIGGGPRWTRRASAGFLFLAIAVSGCGGTSQGDPPSSGSGSSGSGGPGEGNPGTQPGPNATEFSYESLDATALEGESRSWCTAPELSPTGFVPLDQARFAELFADYTKGWMQPLHLSLLGIDEEGLFNAFFEVFLASYATSCNDLEPEDLEGIPPDNELLDPRNQADVESEVAAYINSGTELESGERLRLSMFDCEPCGEPLGTRPYIVDAQLTEDGVIVLQIELSEGTAWTQTAFVTPDAVVVQAPLEGLFEWLRTSTSDTRAGDVNVPHLGGTLTFVARKDNVGGVSATFGISSFALESHPDAPENVSVATSTPCIGMHMAISAADEAVQAAAYLGETTAVMDGAYLCDETECGPEERASQWSYDAGNVALVAEQPDLSSEKELELYMSASNPAAMRVGQEIYSSMGPGSFERKEGGDVGVNVDVQEGGYLVAFDPPLDFHWAMMISKMSDELRADLPDWLTDEVFDVSFGGSPRASIFVPARQRCAQGENESDPPEPERRQVEVREGTLEFRADGDLHSVQAGQCGGLSLEDESTFMSVADWVDWGFSCH